MLRWILILFIIAGGAFLTYHRGKLSLKGAITGAMVAIVIFSGTGVAGLVMMAVFFGSAVLATQWRMPEKETLRLAERDKGRRNAWQVLANAGAAALFALCALYSADPHLVLLVAACFSAATADTLSSELGTLYGKKFYNIISLKRDTRGRDGVISLEGTLIGIGGSFLIAVVYALFFGWDVNFYFIIIAGTAGNLVDSLLGATAERRQLIGNDLVNFTCTLFAAAVMEALYQVYFFYLDPSRLF
ncbi:MAG: DUF92 domain-containing protein [Flavisolibacter sp.]